MEKTFLVITSISSDENAVLQSYGAYCKENKVPFILIGDHKTPKDFHLEGCDFYGLDEQMKLHFRFAQTVPENHYSRKNIGYLLAAEMGADVIIETDDDNYALPDFWKSRSPVHKSVIVENQSWTNVYRYFSKEKIWPRGFALEYINKDPVDIGDDPLAEVYCPVQQGLVDENPDVDAIFRLSYKLPFSFERKRDVSIGLNTWCPFNSQNTTWFREAFLLLYLPSFCSIRMTDIWRSFIAQRICWENNWHILFHNSTLRQERNAHNLVKDFEDEIPGYLNNHKIAAALSDLVLLPGKENIGKNLVKCYEALVRLKIIGEQELPLLESWIMDMNGILEALNAGVNQKK
jgi:hypothetical protein